VQEAELQEIDGKVFRPEMVEPGTQKEKLEDGGFKNIGEFLHAVKYGDSKGKLEAWKRETKDLATGDVGVLIPPQFAANILMLDAEAEVIGPRAFEIPAGSPPDAEFTAPYFSQGGRGALGGVRLTWTAEGQVIQPVNDPQIKDMTLKPKEVSGLAVINNKTLINWEAAGAFVERLLRLAYAEGRDDAFINGNGVARPLGLANPLNTGAIRVPRATAGTIGYGDTTNMISRLYAPAMAGAFWLATQDALPIVMAIADGAGRIMFNGGDAAKGIPATLLGLPIKWTGKQPLLGNAGDLILCNLNPYYMIKPGSGPFVAVSDQFRFGDNKTVFRIVANIDGQPWVNEPLMLSNGLTVSPYVILE
jgi:HK97 family phage major capsid protein